MLGTERTYQGKHSVVLPEGQFFKAVIQFTADFLGLLIAHVVAFTVVPVQRIHCRMIPLPIKEDWVGLDILPQPFYIVAHFITLLQRCVSC